MIKDYEDIAKSLIATSKEPCEVFLSGVDASYLDVKGSKLSNVESSLSLGAGVRVIYKDKLGFAFTEDITKSSLKKTLKLAKLVAVNKGIPVYFKEFPGKSKYKKPKVFDNKTAKLEMNVKIKEYSDVLSNMKSQSLFLQDVMGAYNKELYEHLLINSSGVNHYEKRTNVACLVECTIKGKPKVQSGWYDSAIRSSDISIEKIATRALERAMQVMNPSRPPAGKYDILFDPAFFKEFITSGVGSVFNGEAARMNKSYAAGQLDKKIFSEQLTIKEMPHVDYGLTSSGLDGEGLPTTQKTLIKNGVLKKLIYDLNIAKRYGVKPTGNGFRYAFNQEPRPRLCNISIAKGDGRMDDMIAGTKRGILIYDALGMHNFNGVSGNFAVTVQNGIMIRDGELAEGVTGLSFAGKIQNFLSNIDLLSKTRERIDSYTLPWASFKSIAMA